MTANQAFKKSSTELSFRDWLNEEQLKGNFLNDEHEVLFNASGEEVLLKEKVSSLKSKVVTNNFLGVIAVGILIYGIYLVTKNSSPEEVSE
jgi:hypothetical protein